MIHVSAAYARVSRVISDGVMPHTYGQVNTNTTCSGTQQEHKGFLNGKSGESINSSLTLFARNTTVDTFISIFSSTKIIGENVQTTR
jgi:hypothetical protein